MTAVTYSPKEHRITLDGHAGYAESGKDIVCAGISALLFAVPATLRKKDIKYFLDLNEPEGFVSIKAYPEKKERHECEVILDTVAMGLKLLADHYPENVTYKKE